MFLIFQSGVILVLVISQNDRARLHNCRLIIMRYDLFVI